MRLPMFPLGSVLFPGGVLPLQVFETRYRTLVADIARTDNRFGVVLIRRGNEVGGGDERHDFGAVARVVRKGETEDGRILITAIGTERFKVQEWLDDDPYPVAVVELRNEPAPPAESEAALRSAATARRRLVALAIEMGAQGQQLDLDLPDDPAAAAWALCAAAPLGSFDRQQLLETDGVVQRLTLLAQLLNEQAEDLARALRES